MKKQPKKLDARKLEAALHKIIRILPAEPFKMKCACEGCATDMDMARKEATKVLGLPDNWNPAKAKRLASQ